MKTGNRCWWCGDDPDYVAYHDTEWGFPVHEDRRLFEKLSLEAFQSGLSWRTILAKREGFRAAFENFEFERVAGFGSREVERLLKNPEIVRHRGKIEATIHNARQALEAVTEHGSLAAMLWRFEPEPTTRPAGLTRAWLEAHPTTPESTELARHLKRSGWKFVGPTTAYAFMQAMGLVNDHLQDCPTQVQVEKARKGFSRPN